MGVKTGFFSSYDGDRLYGASDLNDFLDGLVGEGVFKNYKDGLKVITTGHYNEQIMVSEGKAWFHNTYTIVDGGGITLETSNFFPLNVKSFYVVIEVGDSLKQRKNSIMLASSIDTTKHFPLAYVQRVEPYGTITSMQDLRGTDQCPWVAGLLANFTANEIVDQITNPTFAERLDQLIDIKYQETKSEFDVLYTSNETRFNGLYAEKQTSLTELYNEKNTKLEGLYTEEKTSLDGLHDSNVTRFNILYDSVSASAKAIVDEVLRQMPTVPLDLDLTDDNGNAITGMNGETAEEIQGLIHAVVRTEEEVTT